MVVVILNYQLLNKQDQVELMSVSCASPLTAPFVCLFKKVSVEWDMVHASGIGGRVVQLYNVR